MKKILLIAVILMTGLSASSFEETEKACNGGDAHGCYNIGLLYEKGEGVDKNDYIASIFYSRACDGGDAYGCHWLGDCYKYGKGVKKNTYMAEKLYAHAKKLYKIACDDGDSFGCKYYSDLNKR